MHEECSQPRPRCPFFGFHWPEKGSNLVDTGTNECGLDLECHGPCKMQGGNGQIDFYRCDLPVRARNFLAAGRHYIRFYPAELPGTGIEYEPWRDLTTAEQKSPGART